MEVSKKVKKVIELADKVNRRVDVYNAKHDPLVPFNKADCKVSNSFIPFGLDEDYPIGLEAGCDGHGIVIGASGSGKTTCFVFPTLMWWEEALVCMDVKGEVSERYRFLKSYNYVSRPEIVFDPEDEHGPRYDPFQLIGKYPMDKNVIISSIVKTLIPDLPEYSDNSFWTLSAQTFLQACLIFLYNEKELSFIEAIRAIQTTTIHELIKEINSTDDEAKTLISSSVETNPNLISSISADIHNALQVFSDPYISRAFDRNTAPDGNILTWDMVQTHNIFLKLPSEKIKHWKSAFNIMYSQLIFTLNKRDEKYSKRGEKNVQTLILMDEFASFGKIPFFEDDIATLRSKSVNIFIVLQSISQLDGIYGVNARKVIMDNCSHALIFGCNDTETRTYFSEMIGTCNRLKGSVSKPIFKGCDNKSCTLNFSLVKESVIEPHELGALGDNVLVVSEGKSFRLKKIKWSKKLQRKFIEYSEFIDMLRKSK